MCGARPCGAVAVNPGSLTTRSVRIAVRRGSDFSNTELRSDHLNRLRRLKRHMANLSATTGTDNNTQTAGTDTVTVSNTNQIQSGDFFDGAGGADAIVISGSTGVSVNLSGAGTGASTGFHNYEGLTFNNTSGTSMATLSSAQFGSTLISNSLTVTGAAGTQAVVVNIPAAGSFDASGWTFTSWTAGTDTITINGSSGTDTVTGSSQNDTLNGNGGADTLNGG